MLPQSITITPETAREALPSNTYRLDVSEGRIYGRVTDSDAMLQAIQKILITKRYAHVTYTGAYGVELDSLIGQSYAFIQAELPRRIREALTQDDRVLSVDSVTMKKVSSDSMLVDISVSTVYGKIETSMEVTI